MSGIEDFTPMIYSVNSMSGPSRCEEDHRPAYRQVDSAVQPDGLLCPDLDVPGNSLIKHSPPLGGSSDELAPACTRRWHGGQGCHDLPDPVGPHTYWYFWFACLSETMEHSTMVAVDQPMSPHFNSRQAGIPKIWRSCAFIFSVEI